MHDWWWGALVGKTVIAAFTPLCALALLAAGRRFYSTSAGVIAALVYISIPWLTSTAFPPNVNVSSSGLIEGASACYLFLALYAVLLSGRQSVAVQGASQPQVRSTHPAALLALAGYLAGAAVATKYPAVLFVLIPLAIWTWSDAPGGRARSRDRWSAAREQPLEDPLTPVSSGPPPVLNPEPRTLNPLVSSSGLSAGGGNRLRAVVWQELGSHGQSHVPVVV